MKMLPLLGEVEHTTTEETKNFYKQLRRHKISKKTAQNIVKFYEG